MSKDGATDTVTAKIRRMPEELANQIAAGEVVERPASVVKELMENSLDAGATSIAIVVEKSGKDRIRVTDNGMGMSPDDARLALARHATSKLFSADDLNNIASLGFRGEALPSIASVSHFTLATREPSSESGVEIVVEGGKTVREGAVGLPPGTIIDVRRLFYNVPARRKFLRADVTESTHITAHVSNLAAAYPDVHFRLDHGKRTILDAPSVSERRDRLYQLEKRWTESAIPLEESVGSFGLQAWLSPPAESRGASSRLHVFVNGRPVKDRILTHAVLEAYRQVSSKTGTPLAYVFIELPPSAVDVNVHPAKMEVRFAEQQFVHRSLFSVLRNALQAQGRAPEIFTTRGAVEGGYTDEATPHASPAVSGFSPSLPYGGAVREPSPTPFSGRAIAEALAGEELRQTPKFAEFADRPPRPIGQFRHSFILATDENNVWLVDQHAAHERILYEHLVERQTELGQQLLLTPLPLELSPAERVTMEEELEEFVSFGYDIEPFGSDSYILRAVPAALSGMDAMRLVRSALGEQERECRSSTVGEARGRIAARLACHAAIKINFELAMEKMQYLVTELWKARQPTVCPHGRPTTLRVGKEQVERNFGRI